MSAAAPRFQAPRLCLRVAVTANRWRLPGDGADVRIDPDNRESLEITVRHVLTQIAKAVGEAHAVGVREQCYDSAPAIIRLISPLAEGGDRLVAAVATTLTNPWELYVIAPEDLSKKPDRDPHIALEPLWNCATGHLTLGGRELDEESLVEVNRRLLWNCDLLVSIWDKHGARGEAGTGNVILLASELGLPVVNIDANPAAAPIGDTIPFHAFRVLEPNGQREAENSDSAIHAVVMRLVGPPTESPELAADERSVADAKSLPHETTGRSKRKAKSRSALSLLQAFRAEEVSSAFARRMSGLAWSGVMRALTMFAKHPVHLPPSHIGAQADEGFPPPWERASVPAPLASTQLVNSVSPSFRRADYFATAYAIRHRGTTGWLVVLAPLAVMLAWLGQPTSSNASTGVAPSATPFVVTMALLEVLVLISILWVYLRARRKEFHERWLDYRLLAERLRHLGFLWFVARGSPVQRVPVQNTPEDAHTAWVNWWYRATARLVPIPSVHFSAAYLHWYRDFLREQVVEDQENYLNGVHYAAELAERRLRAIAWIPFLLALVAATGHATALLLHRVPPFEVDMGMAFVALVLPGLGAALQAFAGNLGLPEQALRSRSTVRALRVVLEGLRDVKIDGDNQGNLEAGVALGDLAQQTASALGDDLVGWRVDYLVRPTPQPG